MIVAAVHEFPSGRLCCKTLFVSLSALNGNAAAAASCLLLGEERIRPEV